MVDPSLKRTIDRYFEGRLSRAEAKDMFARLDDADAHAAAREYFERRRRLALIDPRAPTELDRIGRSLGLVTDTSPARRWWSAKSLLSIFGAATAALVLVWAVPEEASDFIPRGVEEGLHLSIFDLTTTPAPVGESITTTTPLAFVYQTSEPGYLMVFAVDAAGRVYWYHPAWTDPSHDPTAIPIAPSHQPTELPEAIRHAFVPGPVYIVALFTRAPMEVRAVEAILGRPSGPGSFADLPGTVWSRRLNVREP